MGETREKYDKGEVVEMCETIERVVVIEMG